jgi:replicative DNA helicase
MLDVVKIIGKQLKLKLLTFILLIVLFSTLGCTEDMNTVSKAAKVSANQGVIGEYNEYSAQYKIRIGDFNEAVDNWNTKLTSYNDYMAMTNSMSSSKRTSSAIQDEIKLKASEVRSAGRNMQVESVVFGTFADDMLTFMKENKDSLMNYDSQFYMQQKSFLVEQQARCDNTKEIVNNVLSKLD